MTSDPVANSRTPWPHEKGTRQPIARMSGAGVRFRAARAGGAHARGRDPLMFHVGSVSLATHRHQSEHDSQSRAHEWIDGSNPCVPADDARDPSPAPRTTLLWTQESGKCSVEKWLGRPATHVRHGAGSAKGSRDPLSVSSRDAARTSRDTPARSRGRAGAVGRAAPLRSPRRRAGRTPQRCHR